MDRRYLIVCFTIAVVFAGPAAPSVAAVRDANAVNHALVISGSQPNVRVRVSTRLKTDEVHHVAGIGQRQRVVLRKRVVEDIVALGSTVHGDKMSAAFHRGPFDRCWMVITPGTPYDIAHVPFATLARSAERTSRIFPALKGHEVRRLRSSRQTVTYVINRDVGNGYRVKGRIKLFHGAGTLQLVNVRAYRAGRATSISSRSVYAYGRATVPTAIHPACGTHR